MNKQEKRRKKKETVPDPEPKKDGWLTSYADFITTLAVVFVVLYAMAIVDQEKYSALAASLRVSLGASSSSMVPTRGSNQPGLPSPIKPGSTSGAQDTPAADSSDYLHVVVGMKELQQPIPAPKLEPSPPPQTTSPPPAVQPPPPAASPPPTSTKAPTPPPPKDKLQELKEQLKTLQGAQAGVIHLSLEDRGLVITIAGSVLFDYGKTTLRPEARPVLDEVAHKLQGIDLPMMVEGTSDEGLKQTSEGLSPWDLSSLRAGTVVRYLVQTRGLPGDEVVVIGHGGDNAGHPPDGRVTILVLRRE